MKSSRSLMLLLGLVNAIAANALGAHPHQKSIEPTLDELKRRALAVRDTTPIYLPRFLTTPRRGQVLAMRHARKKHAASLLGTGLNRAERRLDARRLRFA